MRPRVLWKISPWIAMLCLLSPSWMGFSGCSKKKKSPPTPIPIFVPSPTPVAIPSPTPLPNLPTPRPAPSPTPLGIQHPTETQGSGDNLPQAESLPVESQAMIRIEVGSPIKTAEGTTLVLEQVQVQYSGEMPLRPLWTLLEGPRDSIKIQSPNEMYPRIVIGDLQQPAEWILRLQVSDGKIETSADLKVSAFPAKLQLSKRVYGGWVGIQRMGENWVAARGNEVEVFNAEFNPLARFSWNHPIVKFFTSFDKAGKSGIFIQSPEGNWALLQVDSAQQYHKVELPMLGRAIRRVVPFELEGAPYFFALLERSIELWNLSDPTRPTLKRGLGGFLKKPLFLAFAQRNLYVAEEDFIHLIDFSTGNRIASLPSGGSITALATYQVGEKNYLMAAIGMDRTVQGRKDYGLRIFEIDSGGRLGSETRIVLGDRLPVKLAYLIPNTAMALLGVPEKKGLTLRMVDLKQGKEIPLSGESIQGYLEMNEIVTGRINNTSIAVIADGNQLQALAFKPEGTPPTKFTVSSMKSFPGILSSAWVKASADGSRVWLGDEGSAHGGSLAILDGTNLQILEVHPAPERTYPAHADFKTGGDLAPLLYLAEDKKALAQGGVEGVLGLLSLNTKEKNSTDFSKNLIGAQAPEGQLRGSGIAGRVLETGLRIVVAVARVSGNLAGAGLIVLEKKPEQPPATFLSGELAKTMQLIPLQDARDVVLAGDGKTAFVAAGTRGVLAVDLEKKIPLARMSFETEEWSADRILLSNREDLLMVSFINPSNRKVLVKIFGITAGFQMQEYGSIVGLPAVMTVEGVRAPRPAVTEDDLYLMIPSQARVLAVYNLSNPAEPAKISELEVDGEIRGVALANRFKDVFLALGPAGVAKLEFGF